ncbi:peroxiredoxin [Lutibacter maritimus]|uniref:thioredoxin-dependent peroxiredoxin n=1 Tax=Lutibacter maritimus TaxID=593133 RepID=A0A1I6R3F9_9FLAO|nr:peroxiredoxin [Lutibacter maritimus]SFS59287.1 peroxiredoxin Q/BCP [Lutibacter maritimus]
MKTLFTSLLLITLTITGFSQELTIGDHIAPFSGTDASGKTWESAKVTSDFLVVYFYPAAMTGGCTKQACAYRDNKASFDKLNVSVIGVSGDEVEGLQHFKESYQLNFPLLSDAKGTISKVFGVPTTEGGTINKEFDGESFLLVRGVTTPRWTFILNKERKIIYKNADVNAADDSKIVKEVIEKYLK